MSMRMVSFAHWIYLPSHSAWIHEKHIAGLRTVQTSWRLEQPTNIDFKDLHIVMTYTYRYLNDPFPDEEEAAQITIEEGNDPIPIRQYTYAIEDEEPQTLKYA